MMIASGLGSSMSAFIVVGVLCSSCMINSGTGDDNTGLASPATGYASAGDAPASPGEWSRRKVMPIKPPDQPGAATDGSLPAKPAATRTGLAPAAAIIWTVDLGASPTSLWPAAYSTLTATTNMDVGPTPYYIRIWDRETSVYLATCGTGTTCSAAVTRANADFTSFMAVVSDAAGVVVASSFADVYWHGAGVRLTESAPTVPVGGATTLTAITDYDVATSPFHVEIYDITTATVLRSCGAGTRCSVTVSQTTAATHRYRACFAVASSSFPPSSFLECAVDQYATWASTSTRIVLMASRASDTAYTVTAMTSIDVGSTPYFTQIYTLEGDRIASCGTGTTCSTTFSPEVSGSSLVAFVAPSSPTLNMLGIAQANSCDLLFLGGQGVPHSPTGPPPIGPVGIPQY